MYILAVSAFSHLFYSLASNLETVVRIKIKELCQALDIESEHYESMLSDKYEIFDIYNPAQIKELKTLEQRLNGAHERIPKHNTVLKYENNLSYLIKHKILERKKEKVGIQSKNIYVIKN